MIVTTPARQNFASELESGLAKPQIPIISGLRALAVFLVIFLHSGFPMVPGGLGVLIFFVISGFLITWLLLKESESKGSVSLWRFYARRSLRIFPAFYCYALVTLTLLLIFRKHINWPQTAASLLYTANYYQAILGDPSTGFSHTWSLGVEEQFYLCWPAMFVALRGRPRLLIQSVALLIGAVWVYRFILKLVLHVPQGYIYEAFDTRMDHLLIGCILALLLFHNRGHRAWTLICGKPMFTTLIVGLLFLSVWAEIQWADLYRDTWGFILNPVLCALLIPQLISLRECTLVRWLDHPSVRYLGTISYSLYLYQQLILDPVRKAARFTPHWTQIAISLCVLVFVASGSYYLVEKPFLRLKQRHFN